MKFVSLFSGGGGLDRGLEQAGHECIMLCENNPLAIQILKEHFVASNPPIVTDIVNLTSLPKETEMIAAGFPCIDVSKVGNRKGLEGADTGMVRHLFRLLKQAKSQSRPVPWVLLENVEGILDRHGESPPVIAYVQQQFIAMGYTSTAYRIVSTAGFGLPSKRRRLFFIASYYGDARDVLLSQGPQGCNGGCTEAFNGAPCHTCYYKAIAQGAISMDSVAFGVDIGSALTGPVTDSVPTMTTSNERMMIVLPDGKSGLLRIEDAERLQGFPPNYTRQEGAKMSHRWDILANAVTVPVGKWLGDRLACPYNCKYLGVDIHAKSIDTLLKSTATEFTPAPPPPSRAETSVYNYFIPDNLTEHIIFTPDLDSDDDEELVATVANDGTGTVTTAEGQAVSDTTDAEMSLNIPSSKSTAEEVMDTIDKSYGVETKKALFQGRVLNKISSGKVNESREKQTGYNRDSFPRCAWYVKGQGMFAVTEMSDTPIPHPYTTLGNFIQHELVVGKEYFDQKMIWFHRMKAHGFKFERFFWEKMISDGALDGSIDEEMVEVMEINRIPGLLKDEDLIGTVVWAHDGRMYWPAELIDPMDPPSGFTMPAKAISMLSPQERLASLPRGEQDDDGTVVDGSYKRFLALFYPVGNSMWKWVADKDTEYFDPNATRIREKEGMAAMTKNRSSVLQKQRFAWAIQDAIACQNLKTHKESRNRKIDEMRRKRAAQATAGVDMQKRCGKCKTCTAGEGSSGAVRRQDCLRQRMIASALSGHTGAQLAVCKQYAIGAQIQVWWSGNKEFFPAIVAHYNPFTTEHSVIYEDGEVGIYALWQSTERIRVLNDVSEWPKHAQEALLRLRFAEERDLARRDALFVVADQERDAILEREATDAEKERYSALVAHHRKMFALNRSDGDDPAADVLNIDPPVIDVEAALAKLKEAKAVAIETEAPAVADEAGKEEEESGPADNAAAICCLCAEVLTQESPQTVCSSCFNVAVHLQCLPLRNKSRAERVASSWECIDCEKKRAEEALAASKSKRGGKKGRKSDADDKKQPKKQKTDEVVVVEGEDNDNNNSGGKGAADGVHGQE